MKRFICTFLLCCLCFWTFTADAFSAIQTTAQTGTNFIKVIVDELSPGYYIGAVWNGEELLTLFDYTVGGNGRMETNIDLGVILSSNSNLQLGISGANTNSDSISYRIPIIPANQGNNSNNNSNSNNTSNYDDYIDSVSDSNDEIYQVTSTDKIVGGQIKFSPNHGNAERLIVIMINPDKGYTLDNLSVKDTNGNNVKITNIDNIKYTFKMPNADVNINAIFKSNTATTNLPIADLSLTDIQTGTWYYEAVQYVYNKGVMTGESYALFGPHTNLKRAMLVEILYRMENSPVVSLNTPFIDITNNLWYSKAVAWASYNGIINGYENSMFEPWRNVTREEMSTILKRYADYKGYNLSTNRISVNYNDINKISAWATDAMQWALDCGLINGDNKMLMPQADVSRAEAAAILMRFDKILS